MFSLIYLWRDDKDILNGLFVAFSIMYMLLGLISNGKNVNVSNSIINNFFNTN